MELANSRTAADVLLGELAELGVDYLFANAGTDFPPIIEAYARREARGEPCPKPVTVPHENVAVSLAIGAYLTSGRPQAVMVHVNVGTANALCALMNAFRGNIPLILLAGRTPYTESGRVDGARSGENHWAQEMFDQGGLVRENVKWEFEVPHADVIRTAVARAHQIALSEPKGPVYLTLPREVLAAPAPPAPARRALHQAVTYRPDPHQVALAADIIRNARNPLIITTNGGRTAAESDAIAGFAERFAVPVSLRKPRYMAIPTDHPMHAGYDPDSLLADADAVIAIECDVPWIPAKAEPPETCKVIQIGTDPAFVSYPLRGLRCDVALAGPVSQALADLDNALIEDGPSPEERTRTRREAIAVRYAARRSKARAQLADSRRSKPIDPVWLSRCIDQIKGEEGIIVRELPLVMSQMEFRKAGCYFSPNWAAGLGSGLGVALGVRLMNPGRLVICVVGDGSYMFGTPVAAHYVAKACGLPILTVIFNNARWDAVRRSTRSMYPAGAAASTGPEAFTYFDDDMAYEKVVEAAGGYGVCVSDPEALADALAEAVRVVMQEGRQAVVNVVCG